MSTSIGSLSTSTSTSIRGYGGLASGLDRDELIKGMTIGTTNKITQQEQKKQQLQWQQEAVQAISSTMIDFHSKYTETLTSPTNLFSAMLWGRNNITTSGVNSKYVSVTGTASAADAITIMGIKQKAEDAKWSSSEGVSKGELNTGKIDIKSGDSYKKENLIGTSIDFKYGETSYSLYLSNSDDYDYTSAQGIADSINKLLGEQTTSQDKKLSTVLEAFVEKDANGNDTVSLRNIDSSGNNLTLTGGSALKMLGLADSEGNVINEGDLGKGKTINSTGLDGVTTDVDFFEYVKGSSLTFSYNGATTTWKVPDDLKEKAEAIGTDSNGDPTKEATIQAIATSIQDQLDKSFGSDRVKVEVKNGELSFTTTIPGGGKDDSSIFSITGGSAALTSNKRGALTNEKGESAFQVGSTTRLNLNTSIAKSGISGTVTFDKTDANDGSKYTEFKINDKTIRINETDSINDVMKKINESGANVTVAYQEAADKFTFTSLEKGASGVIKFDDASKDVVNALFGLGLGEQVDDAGAPVLEKRGNDAIVSVKYAGSDEIVNIRRDSNSFTIDGLTIGIKGTFGEYNGDILDKDKIEPDQAVEVEASVDVDKVFDTIKAFVESYNAIVDKVNTELTTKHESDYTPLTSDQKSELSDDEISKWETKAKEGLLYGDSDLRSLSMDLRVVVSGGLLEKFKDIGITVSSTYSDNGKLSIDESKLRGALQTDPESVEKLFTSTAGVDENGNQTYNGLATNLKAVMNKYVNTMGSMESKGILIRKAGSQSSALSLTQNTYYNQLKSIDETLEKLKAKLKTEQDRYISQFTTLETLISNMNSQSSYLSSMFSY